MSKAFTRESDEEVESRPPRPVSPLPPGARNYLTPTGAKQLQEELERLIEAERTPESAASDVFATSQKPPARIARIRHLEEILQMAEIVPAPAQPWQQVRFGATVTVRDAAGAEAQYRIVGVDEVDLDRDWVSWLTPVAKALLNSKLGQRIRFRVPAGEQELEIIAVAYE